MIMLIISILVNGKKNLIFLDSYFKSPNKLPKRPNLSPKIKNIKPNIEIVKPMKINHLPISIKNYIN